MLPYTKDSDKGNTNVTELVTLPSLIYFFEHLKNPYQHVGYPQYHWPDQKLKVHTSVRLIRM